MFEGGIFAEQSHAWALEQRRGGGNTVGGGEYYLRSSDDAKKRSTDFSPKKQVLRRVVEGLFLSNAGPKSGRLSYLIAIIGKETSDVW